MKLRVGVGPEHDDIVSLSSDGPQELDVLLDAVAELLLRSRYIMLQTNSVIKKPPR